MKTDLQQKLFRPRDAILAAALLVIAAIVFFIFRPTGSGKSAVIDIDGKTVREINLGSNGVYYIDCTINGSEKSQYTFDVKNNAVAVTSAGCHDKICVKTGYISSPGSIIACVPAHMTVTIKSDDTSAPDAVTY